MAETTYSLPKALLHFDVGPKTDLIQTANSIADHLKSGTVYDISVRATQDQLSKMHAYVKNNARISEDKAHRLFDIANNVGYGVAVAARTGSVVYGHENAVFLASSVADTINLGLQSLTDHSVANYLSFKASQGVGFAAYCTSQIVQGAVGGGIAALLTMKPIDMVAERSMKKSINARLTGHILETEMKKSE